MVCALRSDGKKQNARENERVCREPVFVLAGSAGSDAAVVDLTGVGTGEGDETEVKWRVNWKWGIQ